MAIVRSVQYLYEDQATTTVKPRPHRLTCEAAGMALGSDVAPRSAGSLNQSWLSAHLDQAQIRPPGARSRGRTPQATLEGYDGER